MRASTENQSATLPAEDTEDGMCGILDRTMYGTLDASEVWHDCHMEHLERLVRALVCVNDFALLVDEPGVDHVQQVQVKSTTSM